MADGYLYKPSCPLFADNTVDGGDDSIVHLAFIVPGRLLSAMRGVMLTEWHMNSAGVFRPR